MLAKTRFETVIPVILLAALVVLMVAIAVSADTVAKTGEDVDPGNARYTIFDSLASDLVPGDTNNAADVFVRDLETGETTLASINSHGVQGNSHSFRPSLSADGRQVAFYSVATNLVDDDGRSPIFVHDLETGTTSRLAVDDGDNSGIALDPSSLAHTPYVASMTSDGSQIAFWSNTGDPNDPEAIGESIGFVYDLESGTTTRIDE